MLPLRALLATHPTLLLIDSASSRVQIGLLRASAPAVWETSLEETGTALFACTEKILARAASNSAPLPLSAIDAFLFCDGPGSVLGIRTAAAALRTWNVLHPRPNYAYGSLALVAHALSQDEQLHNASVIADARRETWHRVTLDAAGTVSPLQRVPTAELSGPLILPENFRHWSTLPPAVRTVPYSLSDLLPRLVDTPLFTEALAPDAFLHEAPSYATWTPQIHRPPP